MGAQNLVIDALSRKPQELKGQLFCNNCVLIFGKQLQRHPKYAWNGQVLKRKGRAIVGDNANLRRELFEYFYSGLLGGHSGAHATRAKIFRQFYWTGLSKDIKKWV
ncbi:Integrase, catalytic core [Gossypium australe]|uniref:Integrase, catalytic core n=1 Tax=Gossypium australe TaxID=47621 RepID=A0A5B6WIM6_9ROSI|nr:Integrase, catalytic core [Gossypium australe]